MFGGMAFVNGGVLLWCEKPFSHTQYPFTLILYVYPSRIGLRMRYKSNEALGVGKTDIVRITLYIRCTVRQMRQPAVRCQLVNEPVHRLLFSLPPFTKVGANWAYYP